MLPRADVQLRCKAKKMNMLYPVAYHGDEDAHVHGHPDRSIPLSESFHNIAVHVQHSLARLGKLAA